jgi:DNA replication protein DnaC
MASEERDRLIQNLKRLGLPHAANNLDEHLKQASSLKLGHLAFLARVMEAEVLARQQTRADRRMRYAEFPEVCRIEDYDFKQQPSLDRKTVLNLAELGFVDRCESVLWIGPSGVGKTHLAIALGVRACQANYSVRYVRAYPLLRHLYASLADDTLEEVLNELAKPDVLIIDELGNSPKKLENDLAGVFFELVARRYRRGVVILTTNLGFDQWPSVLGSPSQVTPAIDRLIEGRVQGRASAEERHRAVWRGSRAARCCCWRRVDSYELPLGVEASGAPSSAPIVAVASRAASVSPADSAAISPRRGRRPCPPEGCGPPWILAK